MDSIDKIYFALSGIFSVFLYVLLILFILFLMKTPNPISISISNPSLISAISVNLIDEIPQNSNIIKQSESQDKPSSGSKSPLAGIGASELFKKIDTNNPNPRDLELSNNREKLALNEKPKDEANPKDKSVNDILNETQNIMQTLENLNQNSASSDLSSSEFCEKHADYCNEISNLLYKNWNMKSGFDDTLASVVIIKISKDGNFSYTIKKKSGNREFDRELESSLENLLNTRFPTIEGIDINNLEVIFKNKKENK